MGNQLFQNSFSNEMLDKYSEPLTVIEMSKDGVIMMVPVSIEIE